MVKVSIRDYMPPYTSWMQVELEGNVCVASPDIKQDQQGSTSNQEGETGFKPTLEDADNWD